MSETWKRVFRTLLQLVVSGGLTAAVTAISGGLAPAVAALVLAGWQLVVTWAQNSLEEKKVIPSVMKT